METGRRAFLGTLGAGLVGARFVRAQSGGGAPQPKIRKAKTSTLFKSPEGYPNAIRRRKRACGSASRRPINARLVDWNGKLLKTVKTESKNTSGMGVGGGFIWMAANAGAEGIFQTDMNSTDDQPPADSAGPRQRRRLPRRRVRRRQAVDRGAAAARHSPRRCEDVGAGVPDPV